MCNHRISQAWNQAFRLEVLCFASDYVAHFTVFLCFVFCLSLIVFHKTPEIIYTNNGHFVFFCTQLCKNKHLITVLTASLHAEPTHELAYAQHYDDHYCCTSPARCLAAAQIRDFC